ncbi:hypothetical protein DB31_5667 [Hyalangium minutum]|uniref:Uncharacterized protein n=1 Tax=Hyalangium minutum TaxID=394096 RepID=A0A085WSG2_9BACT|nr:hypothetical protein DB31_5667 [Hyalangium minutum]
MAPAALHGDAAAPLERRAALGGRGKRSKSGKKGEQRARSHHGSSGRARASSSPLPHPCYRSVAHRSSDP